MSLPPDPPHINNKHILMKNSVLELRGNNSPEF